jgi:hypothetical protein
MSASDLLLAVALLTAPVGTPEQTPPEDRWLAVRDAIHKIAVEWEIMDPFETQFVLTTREDFEVDLNLLRRRHAELADAPRLADCRRLPDRRTADELIKFNRAFRKHLEDRQVWEQDRIDLFSIAIQETDRLCNQWEVIRDAQCDYGSITFRRTALKKLRDVIGEDAFSTGQMPHSVPDWRFASTP